jgi:biotin-[acetyl-CoA-carboxylase] ligase BirA-like protein
VVAGLEVAREVFAQRGVECELRVEDGASVAAGDVVALVRGPARGILEAERTALNFVQRLSGVATLTRRFCDAVRGTRAEIVDTRKTTPGWRPLEKWAVRCGGGRNHRIALYDGILIKDNHIAAVGSAGAAVALARERGSRHLRVRCEVESLEQAQEALVAGGRAARRQPAAGRDREDRGPGAGRAASRPAAGDAGERRRDRAQRRGRDLGRRAHPFRPRRRPRAGMDRPLTELTPRTRWLGQRLEVHAEVDSTNLVAERRALEGAPDGLVVIADRQSAGRGRLGRSFFSPGGRSLYLSALLRSALPMEQMHRQVFAAAVAVAECARAQLPARCAIEIKWPNDVLIDGRKTSGINLPVHLEIGREPFAVLGVGVNVNLAQEELPEELAAIATSLRIAAGKPLDRVAFGEELLARLESELDHVRAGRFGSVLERFRKSFRMAGRRVRIGGPGLAREVIGTVHGVDEDGALLVEPEGGAVERVLAGDVTLLRGPR